MQGSVAYVTLFQVRICHVWSSLFTFPSSVKLGNSGNQFTQSCVNWLNPTTGCCACTITWSWCMLHASAPNYQPMWLYQKQCHFHPVSLTHHRSCWNPGSYPVQSKGSIVTILQVHSACPWNTLRPNALEIAIVAASNQNAWFPASVGGSPIGSQRLKENKQTQGTLALPYACPILNVFKGKLK